MNYQRIYNSIINFRKSNHPTGYRERHHIIPRSIGGTDHSSNLVYLTAREHFVCHYLLTRIYEEGSTEWRKMNHAFMIMKGDSKNQERYYNGRLYESRRKHFSKIMSAEQSGKKNSQFGSRWIHHKQDQKNKKVRIDFPLPPGWEEGRILKWNKSKKCAVCAVEFVPNTKEKFCSDICKKKSTDPFDGKEEKFLTLYRKYGSINKALKELGYPGAVAHYYRWAKSILGQVDRS